jgi:acetolactate decarboxylase
MGIFLRHAFVLGIFFAMTNVSALNTPTLYQAGTIINLTNGLYQGTTSLASLFKKGDFGLGTDNGPEGEMVIIDKQAYAADINGNAHLLKSTDKTPFSMIVQFNPDKKVLFQKITSLSELTNQIDKQLPSNNIFYAIRVTGLFKKIIMRDWEKPTTAKPINQWIKKNQLISKLNHIEGTLVIFKAPTYAGPITVGGYHVHFISKDHRKLGHVYDVQLPNAIVEIESIYAFNLELPQTTRFLNATLESVGNDQIAKIETGNG